MALTSEKAARRERLRIVLVVCALLILLTGLFWKERIAQETQRYERAQTRLQQDLNHLKGEVSAMEASER